MAEEHEVAGVHWHSEVVDLAARGDDTRGHHVAPVDDGRCAGDQRDLGALGPQRRDGAGHLVGPVGAAHLQDGRTVERGEARVDRVHGLFQQALLEARQARLHETHLTRGEGRDAQQRAVLPGDGEAAFEHRLANGEGNDLDRRGHLACLHRRERRQRSHGHCLVH